MFNMRQGSLIETKERERERIENSEERGIKKGTIKKQEGNLLRFSFS